MPAYRVAHLTTAHGRKDIRIFHKECLTLTSAGYEVHEIVADSLGAETADSIINHDIGRSRGKIQRILLKPFTMYRATLRSNADI